MVGCRFTEEEVELREVKSLSHDHRASKFWNQDKLQAHIVTMSLHQFATSIHPEVPVRERQIELAAC